MEDINTILEGKKVLIVDDEQDILETLSELLDMCFVDTALDFKSAEKFLKKNTYDFVVFDIMGVNGYALLETARAKNIPSIMLTAHALSPYNFVKSIKDGAQAYLPKEKMCDIPSYVAEILTELQKGRKKSRKWFARVRPVFNKIFGNGWQKIDNKLWLDFDQQFRVTKEDLRQVL